MKPPNRLKGLYNGWPSSRAIEPCFLRGCVYIHIYMCVVSCNIRWYPLQKAAMATDGIYKATRHRVEPIQSTHVAIIIHHYKYAGADRHSSRALYYSLDDDAVDADKMTLFVKISSFHLRKLTRAAAFITTFQNTYIPSNFAPIGLFAVHVHDYFRSLLLALWHGHVPYFTPHKKRVMVVQILSGTNVKWST